MSDQTQRYDIVLDQGESFIKSFLVQVFEDDAWTAFDLTDYEARLEAKEKLTDETAVISMTSDPAAGLTIPIPVNGIIGVALTPAQTALISSSLLIWNLEIYTAADATVLRILEGYITNSKEVIK